MKNLLPFPSLFSRAICFVVCLFPALLSAHPGHHHPGEVDEFDSFSALSSHGVTGMLLALLVATGVMAICLSKGTRPKAAGALVVIAGLLLVPGL